MKSFEINFSDLNEEAQKRLKDEGFHHDNIELSPLAIYEVEDDENLEERPNFMDGDGRCVKCGHFHQDCRCYENAGGNDGL